MSPVSNKIALFIDGANLYATAKTLGFDIAAERCCARSITPRSLKIRNIRRSAR
jgi:hypothetical protein